MSTPLTINKTSARLTWHEDPGHAWLEVPAWMGIQYGTGFGYMDLENGVVFLEEDCEAPMFEREHGDLMDRVDTLVYNEQADHIRNLPRIVKVR